MFKEGCKVKLKNNLVVGESYNDMTYFGGMNYYEGVVMTVDFVDDDETLSVCENGIWWAFDMLDLVEE